jgi:hypothetical protein
MPVCIIASLITRPVISPPASVWKLTVPLITALRSSSTCPGGEATAPGVSGERKEGSLSLRLSLTHTHLLSRAHPEARAPPSLASLSLSFQAAVKA